jgi:aspartate aminotransferase
MMWFSTPCNLSGSVYDREELTALAKVLENIHTFTLLPMKSMSISISQGTFVASHLSRNVERTITVNGVAKAFAMTGWRMVT